MAILNEGTTKYLSMINVLLGSYNIPEIEFVSENEKTREQIVELAKKTSTHFLESTSGVVYEDREKLLYSIIDVFKKILGPQVVMDIFKDPMYVNQQKGTKTMNNKVSTENQDSVPDISEIPGLEDLLR